MHKLTFWLLTFTLAMSVPAWAQIPTLSKTTDEATYPGELMMIPNRSWTLLDSMANLQSKRLTDSLNSLFPSVKTDNASVTDNVSVMKSIGDATKDYIVFAWVLDKNAVAERPSREEIINLFSLKQGEKEKLAASKDQGIYTTLYDYLNILSGSEGSKTPDHVYIILFDNKELNGKRPVDESKEGALDITIRNQSYRFTTPINLDDVVDEDMYSTSITLTFPPEGKDNMSGGPPPPPPPVIVYDLVDTMPSFPGGELALKKYLSDNIIYPAEARNNKKSGHVIVSFYIKPNGRIGNAYIISDPGYGLGEEALRVVNAMPLWTPGYLNGSPVNVSIKLPIAFKLK